MGAGERGARSRQIIEHRIEAGLRQHLETFQRIA